MLKFPGIQNKEVSLNVSVPRFFISFHTPKINEVKENPETKSQRRTKKQVKLEKKVVGVLPAE